MIGDLPPELKAASEICKIYFDIAVEVIGEEEVRRHFKIKLEDCLKSEAFPTAEEQQAYWESDAFLIGHKGEHPRP